MVGLAFSKYGKTDDKDTIRELVRKDRAVMSDVAALRDKLGSPLKTGKRAEDDKDSKDSKDDKPKISEEEDNEYELFSVALVVSFRGVAVGVAGLGAVGVEVGNALGGESGLGS
jgi:hypothetical protein